MTRIAGERPSGQVLTVQGGAEHLTSRCDGVET